MAVTAGSKTLSREWRNGKESGMEKKVQVLEYFKIWGRKITEQVKIGDDWVCYMACKRGYADSWGLVYRGCTTLILALFRVLLASLVFIEQDHCVVHALDPKLAAQDLPGELRMLAGFQQTIVL